MNEGERELLVRLNRGITVRGCPTGTCSPIAIRDGSQSKYRYVESHPIGSLAAAWPRLQAASWRNTTAAAPEQGPVECHATAVHRLPVRSI